MDGRSALLDWYEGRRHAYPWRLSSDPFSVLVSEVMLQQTGISRVLRSYPLFMRRFPTVASLAGAPRSDVLRAWEGLGYNRRAVALSEAARAIMRDHGGRIPHSPQALARLPGIGPYTSAAVASIAYGVDVAAVDTNASRVISRAVLGADPGEVRSGRVRHSAELWLDRSDPGAWNQAVMDLGREICRPRPRCPVCPFRQDCRFTRAGRHPTVSSPRRQVSFEGSFRQLRGRVVAMLRTQPSSSLAGIAHSVAQPLDRVQAAVASLVADGVVECDAGAPPGAAGVIRLAEQSRDNGVEGISDPLSVAECPSL